MFGKIFNKGENKPLLNMDDREESKGFLDDEEKQTLIKSVGAGISIRFGGYGEGMTKELDKGKIIKWALIFMAISAASFGLSFLFLPIIVVSPHKFAFLFSAGSLCALISMACYHGPGQYIKKLFTKEKAIFTSVYLGSLLMTLFVSVFWGSYIFTILACGV